MKKILVLMGCLISSLSVFAQDMLKEGDDMAALGNYDGAAMMYRMCMEENDQCALRLFKLIYDEKIEPQFTDELYQLISPLAEKGNAEAQYYLGELYLKGLGDVAQDNGEAMKWFQQSAAQGFETARIELEKLLPKEEPVAEQPEVVQPVQPAREESARRTPATSPSTGVDLNMRTGQELKPTKLPGTLFIVGGVSAVAGIAATLLVTSKADDDFSDSNSTGKYLEVTKRNPVFLIAGCVIGGVCIGSGIIIKNKHKKADSAITEINCPQYPYRYNYDMRLNLVATNNGAGFRITF